MESWTLLIGLVLALSLGVLVTLFRRAELRRLEQRIGELGIVRGAPLEPRLVADQPGRNRLSRRQRLPVVEVPDVVAGVKGRAPVFVDSGFRRGGDIFKALALGATAVGVGRPYIWGLTSFGQEGVETVLDILRRELQLVMRQSGVTSIKGITRNHIAPLPGWR